MDDKKTTITSFSLTERWQKTISCIYTGISPPPKKKARSHHTQKIVDPSLIMILYPSLPQTRTTQKDNHPPDWIVRSVGSFIQEDGQKTLPLASSDFLVIVLKIVTHIWKYALSFISIMSWLLETPPNDWSIQRFSFAYLKTKNSWYTSNLAYFVLIYLIISYLVTTDTVFRPWGCRTCYTHLWHSKICFWR